MLFTACLCFCAVGQHITQNGQRPDWVAIHNMTANRRTEWMLKVLTTHTFLFVLYFFLFPLTSHACCKIHPVCTLRRGLFSAHPTLTRAWKFHVSFGVVASLSGILDECSPKYHHFHGLWSVVRLQCLLCIVFEPLLVTNTGELTLSRLSK